MDDRVNGGDQVHPEPVAGTSVPQPSLLEGPSVYPFKFSFQKLGVDRQQMQSQMRSLQEQQKKLVDGQKIIIAFFEKLPEIHHHETVRDPIASIPIFSRGDGNMPVGVQVLGSSHRSVFLYFGKQVLLDNQTEKVCPEDVVTTACHPAISQGVLSSASVTETSRWRYPRISPEHLPQALLEGKLRRNHELSPDPPAKRPARLPAPPPSPA